MRNAFVVAQFQPLRVDQNQAHLIGSRLVQNRHDHGVDGHALACARRAGNQQVRHSRQVGGDDAAVDVFAHGDRHLRLRSHELLRLDVLAQPDDFALAVRHLNADRAFARHALDQNALGFQREAKIVAKIGDAAVLDAGFGLELERRDDRSGIDLRDLAVNLELGVFFGEHLRQQFEFVGVNLLLFVGTLQQAAGRQFVSAAAMRGIVVLALLPLSARAVTSGSAAWLAQSSRLREARPEFRPLRSRAWVASSSIMRSIPVRRASERGERERQAAGRD